MFSWSEFDIIFPAFIAGICVLLVHIPLGLEVIKRGVIFIDISIAQLAAMGAFFASLLSHHHGHGAEHSICDFLITQGCAFGSAILGSLLFIYVEKHHKKLEEAIIGCVFVLSTTLILLALSQNSHAGEHIKELLEGQLLFVSYGKIAISMTMIIGIFIFILFSREKFFGKYFYLIFALTITITVQIAGIYLVFATLIFPAVGTYYIKSLKNKIIVAYLGGVSGLIIALVTALVFDLSTGPAIVWGIAIIMLGIFIYNMTNLARNHDVSL